MALGNNYSGNTDNNKKQKYLPEFYVTSFKTSSPNGLDPSALSYAYAGEGYLKITITPLKFENPNDTNYKYDNDNATSIMLTPSKAMVFAKEIKTLLANPDTVNNVGVNTSSDSRITFIIFSTGKELGIDTPALVIRKMDKESGDILSTYAYQFTGNPNLFGIRNFDENTKHFERFEYPMMEVDNLLMILENFYKAMGGGQTYSNLYYGRFEQSRINTKLKLIMDKLGIETSGEYKRMGRDNSTSFFNNPNNGTTIQQPSMSDKYSNLLEDDYNE